jgi:ribosomal protein L14E/L6E/L27E
MKQDYKDLFAVPKIIDDKVQYFVDGKYVSNLTVNQVNAIRVKVLKYIIETSDINVLNRFYFIGHEDSNDCMGDEIKMTMDEMGNFSASPWEMMHVRRDMFQLMKLDREKLEKSRI